MPTPYNFFYNGQIESYLKQFLRIFSGLQVEYKVDRDGDGFRDRKACHVYYGDMDRITANVLHKNGTFVPNGMPLMAGNLTSVELNQEAKHSKFHKENVVRVNGQGQKVLTQKAMGVPYRANMDLSIYTTNNTQMFQLLEQILMLFNPRITFQTSDNIIDWNYLTEVELISISPEQNFPVGQDERMIIQTLNFSFEFWLDYPAIETSGIINEIFTNIKDNTTITEGVDLDTFLVDENTPL